jgi:hypothetical protein
VSKILRADDIVWLNTADGSWGGCSSEDMIVIRLDDMTKAEREALLDHDEPWGYEASQTIMSAHHRIEREKES